MNLLKTCLVIVSISLCNIAFAQKMLPDVEIKTLDKKTVNLKEAIKENKLTIISFWATWCSPCKKELDNIADLYEEWQEKYGVKIFAITIDNARALSKVGSIANSKGWEYEIYSDENQELKRTLGFQTIPHTLIVDKDGNVLYEHSGYVPGDEDELEDKLIELSAEKE